MQQDQPDHTPWYQPRTAEIIQRGGEGMANSIGQGLQQFGQGIAKGIYERQARKQKEEEDAKETKKEHNYYMGIGEKMGFDKTAMQNAGAEGTKGMVEGTIAKQKFEEFAGRIREQKMKEAATARDASAVAQFQRSATNMTTPMQIPPGTFGPLYRGETIGGPISSEDRFNLMQKSGVNPDDQYKLMRAYGEGAQGNDPTKAMFAKAAVMNAENSVDEAKLRREVFARGGGNKPTVTVEDVVNGKKVRRQLTDEQFADWQGSNPDKATQTLTAKLTELRAAKAAGKTTVDLDQLMGGGVDLSPWWGGKPIDLGIKYLETKLGTAPASADYKTPEDVRAAYKAGNLSREDATKILTEQFKL